MHEAEQWVRSCLTAVRDGRSVEVTGQRLSGRSRFLTDVATALDGEDVTVHRLSGSELLRDRRFGALELAGLVDSTVLSASSPLATAVGNLRDRLDGAVLLLDDADLLDPFSAAVVHQVSRDELPVVAVTRTDLVRPGGPAVPIAADVCVETGPLSIGSLLSATTEQLGRPPSRSLLAEVFSLSLGYAGVARRIVEDGLTSGTIEERRGALVHQSPLTAPSLARLWQDYLRELPPEERQLLCTLALADGTYVDDVPPAALARLTSLGHVRVLRHAGDFHAVVPVLLRQHLRRTSGQASDSVDFASSPTPPARVEESVAAGVLEQRPGAAWNAQLYRQVSARRRARRAQRERTRSARILAPTTETAERGEESILDIVEDVAMVFRRLAAVASEPSILERAEAALDSLDDGTRAAAVAVASVRSTMRIIAGLTQGLQAPEDDPTIAPQVRLLACSARLYRRVVHGDVAGVEPDLDLADVLDEQCGGTASVCALSAPLRALAAAILGDSERARALAQHTIELAMSTDLTEAVPLLGPTISIGLLVAGRLHWAQDLVEVCLALPLPDTVDDRRTTLPLAATLALWGGQPDVAALWSQLVGPQEASGPLPFQSTAWLECNMLRANGKSERAGALLLAHAQRAETLGRISAAAMEAIFAADVHPSPEAVETATRLSQLVDSPALALLREASAAASSVEDVTILLGLYRKLIDHGACVTAYRLLLRASRLPAPPDLVATVNLELSDFRRVHPEAVEVARHTTTGPSLTARERAVVLDVIEGRTSAEVARRQVVSVRTVESQLHSAMKKLGVSRRSELRERTDLL